MRYMKEQHKVTVGIPAYNVEEYALQSIRSAMDQTYKNLEIFVVDDGSRDSTGSIADRLAEEDERIVVVHQENRGLAAVREKIINEMSGSLIYWLDSDDWLKPDAIANSAALMDEYNADIVKTVLNGKDRDLCGCYTRDEYLKILLPDRIKSQLIGCLMKKSLYDGKHFRTDLVNEDYWIFPQLMETAECILVEDSNTYFYREARPGSITTSGRNRFEGFYVRAVLTCDRYQKYKDAYPEEAETILKQFADHALMSCLAADGDLREPEVRKMLALMEDQILHSKSVHPYKKWLMREILRNGKMVPVMRILHQMSGKLRVWRRR